MQSRLFSLLKHGVRVESAGTLFTLPPELASADLSSDED